MVEVHLNNLRFEAEKFETRKMPTPDMKHEEIIYFIKVRTEDKRLANELQRFIEGAPKFIELRVPSALVIAKTEYEDLKVFPARDYGAKEQPSSKRTSGRTAAAETIASDTMTAKDDGNSIRLEILLRRTLPEAQGRQTQSPYG